MFWREIGREPRLAGLFGLILLVIGIIVQVSYPLAGETLWWLGLGTIMTGAVIALRRKYGGTK